MKYLFSDNHQSFKLEVEETYPIILEEEVRAVIQSSKSGKATGPDGKPAEIIKVMDGNSVKMLTRLFKTYTFQELALNNG